jgi:toxin ParE1/3/4
MAKIRLSRKAIADLDSIWNYTAQSWSEEQAVIYYRQIYSAIQGLNNLPVFLEKRYDVIKSGLWGFKVGHHIIFYKKGKNGSISVDRILHEKMDYQRHL